MTHADDTACLNLRWAAALLHGLVEAQVAELVFSPGARSTPLVLAAAREPGLRLHPVVDERGAAFLALGLARAGGRPVALVCTSGSAPAHWHPAVIEAHEWGVPLVLLSADRPPALVDWGANQTTRQTTLFEGHLRARFDPGLPTPEGLKTLRALGRRAAATARWPAPGPVHLNLPFAEPLVPEPDCHSEPPEASTPVVAPAPCPPGAEALAGARKRLQQGRGLILAGPDDRAPDAACLARLARRLDAPVLADPLSGLRFGAPEDLPLVTRYDALLHNPGLARRLRPDWVLRLGRAPVSRRLQEWLAGVPTVLLDPHRRWRDPKQDAELVLAADPGLFCAALAGPEEQPPGPHIDAWLHAEARAQALAAPWLEQPTFEGALVATLLRALPPGAALLLGNSLPVRQVDTWSGRLPQPLRPFGNRGVSGIDGQLATLAGIAAAAPPAFGLIGDLALLHDLNGLALLRGKPATLVVVNNGGGRIFDYLPQRRLPELERCWHTPPALSMDHAAAAFGLPHRRIADQAELREALALPPDQARLLELVVDPEAGRRGTMAYWQAVAEDPEIAQGNPT